jgi:hypothetical protein
VSSTRVENWGADCRRGRSEATGFPVDAEAERLLPVLSDWGPLIRRQGALSWQTCAAGVARDSVHPRFASRELSEAQFTVDENQRGPVVVQFVVVDELLGYLALHPVLVPCACVLEPGGDLR